MADKKESPNQNPSMKVHVSYNAKDKAVEMILYDGDQGLIILLSNDGARTLIQQTQDAIKEHEKQNKLN